MSFTKAEPRKFVRRSCEKVLDLFFPRRCLACREFLDASLIFCPVCEENWPKDSSQEQSFCRIRAAGLYEGLLLDLIIRLKYRGEERLASFLGPRMAREMENHYDLIVPIPLHRDRLRERGFNQALLLAREIGKERTTEVDPFVLVKVRPTPPQAVLKGEERRRNLRGAFEVRRPERVEGKRVLLVDDVYTTGATIETASRKLLEAGAQEVEALVLARAT